MKWIMVANSNDCRIYEYDLHNKHLALVDELSHPEHRLKVSDMTNDKPGHYKSCGTHHGSFEPEHSPLDWSIDDFAREMAERLDKGRNQHSFDDVTLVLPAKMQGLLGKHLNKHTKECVHLTVQKNLSYLSEHELHLYLNKLFSKPQQVH